MAIGLGMVFWLCLLFSPLAFVKTANAQDADSYGTVIGIVSRVANGLAFGSCLVRRALADSKHVLTKGLLGSGHHILLCRCYAEGQG